jgi:hypothetical protein
LYPGIYVTARGYSGDAVIEESERRRQWLAFWLGGTMTRRRSSVVLKSKGEETDYAESQDVSPLAENYLPRNS